MLVLVMISGIYSFPVSAKETVTNQFRLNVYQNAQYTAEAVEKGDQLELQTLSDEIIDFVSQVFISENINVDVRNNIRFLDILKCYNDTDIMQLNTSDATEIKEELNAGNYSYYIYADVEGYKVEITLSKGLPVSDECRTVLTKEQLQALENNVGKWYVSSAGVIKSENICLDEVITEYNGVYDDLLLVSSQTGFDYPVFVGIQNDEATDVIPIYEKQAYEISDIVDEDDGIYSFSKATSVVLSEQYIAENNTLNYENDILSEGTAVPMATGYVRQLSVIRHKQEKSYWCWAASAQMVGHYITKSAKTQSAIVKNVKGSVVNDGASDSELKKAVQYAVGSKYTVSTNNIVPLVTFVNYIYSRKHPAVMKVLWTNNKAHAVVIAGVNSNNNTLYVIDPWESVTNRWMNYNSMCNGTTFGSGTGRYIKFFFVN